MLMSVVHKICDVVGKLIKDLLLPGGSKAVSVSHGTSCSILVPSGHQTAV